MNKKLENLENLKVEDRININKMCKRVSILSENIDYYFENKLKISKKSIKDAYKFNEDLLEILKENDENVKLIMSDSFLITDRHQTNFTQEQKLDIDEYEKFDVEKKLSDGGNLISYDQKTELLSKKRKYIQNKIKINEFLDALKVIEDEIERKDIVNLQQVKQDLNLINSYFDKKRAKKYNAIFLLPIFISLSSFILIVILIWKN